MAESPRLMGRNGKLWQEYVRGATQEDLADKYGMRQQQVSEAIKAVRDSIPEQERRALIAEEVDLFRKLRFEVLQLWDMPAAPVTAGKDGDIVRDPETDEIVRDHSGRLAAIDRAEKLSARMHRLLGLEASQRIDLNLGEEEAAKRVAAESLAYLMGGVRREE